VKEDGDDVDMSMDTQFVDCTDFVSDILFLALPAYARSTFLAKTGVNMEPHVGGPYYFAYSATRLLVASCDGAIHGELRHILHLQYKRHRRPLRLFVYVGIRCHRSHP